MPPSSCSNFRHHKRCGGGRSHCRPRPRDILSDCSITASHKTETITEARRRNWYLTATPRPPRYPIEYFLHLCENMPRPAPICRFPSDGKQREQRTLRARPFIPPRDSRQRVPRGPRRTHALRRPRTPPPCAPRAPTCAPRGGRRSSTWRRTTTPSWGISPCCR